MQRQQIPPGLAGFLRHPGPALIPQIMPAQHIPLEGRQRADAKPFIQFPAGRLLPHPKSRRLQCDLFHSIVVFPCGEQAFPFFGLLMKDAGAPRPKAQSPDVLRRVFFFFIRFRLSQLFPFFSVQISPSLPLFPPRFGGRKAALFPIFYNRSDGQ